MTKIITAIAAILILGTGAYFVLSGGDAGAPEGDPAPSEIQQMSVENQQDEEVALGSGVGTFKSIMALGKNVTCNFRYEDTESQSLSEGTVYVADDRMRGDFTLTQDGQVMEMSVIRDGTTSYTWGESPMGPMAYKFETLDDDADTHSTRQEQDPFESDDEVDYDCEKWRVDADTFVPPSDVVFEDINVQMQQLQQFNTGDSSLQAQQCAACEQAPASARAQCLQAIGC